MNARKICQLMWEAEILGRIPRMEGVRSAESVIDAARTAIDRDGQRVVADRHFIDDTYPFQDMPAYEPGSLDEHCIAVTALSLLDHHRSWQGKCLQSWVDFGLTVCAVNTTREIELLEDEYPQVSRWVESNRTSDSYNYPTQLISTLANQAVEMGQTILLLNSDIDIHGKQESLTDHMSPQDQLVGVRWNYDGTNRQTARHFQWGLDAFSFTPEQVKCLPENMPFAIGQPMWDYAVPYYVRTAGFHVNLLHDRLFYHREHDVHWKQAAWDFGASWLSIETGYAVDLFGHSAEFRTSLAPTMFYDSSDGVFKSK